MQNNLVAGRYFALAEGTRGHNLSYSQLKAAGQIDSIATVNQNYVFTNQGDGFKYFHKMTDDTIRYYLQLGAYGGQSGKHLVKVFFDYDTKGSPLGDFCSNAIDTSLNGQGKLHISQWTSIHTIGEGPNEQFTSQLNTPYNEIDRLKTTWFKVTLKNVSEIGRASCRERG